MIFNFVNILFLMAVFTGLGLLFPWNMFRLDRRVPSLLLTFWVGWGMAIVLLQIWHFFWPVGLPAFLILLAGGAAGWWANRQLLIETIRGWDRRNPLITASLALIPAVMVANHVLFSPPNSDYALYHLQSVKWISTYAVIPGLGNLYNPLATNCSSFLYTAAIDSAWLEGRAYYVSNTLLSYVTILQCAGGLYGLLYERRVRNANLFLALLLPLVLMNVSTTHLSAYSPDPIVFFLHVILAGEVLRLFEDGPGDDIYRRRAAQIIFLAAAAVTVKLSLAVFGVLCILPVIAVAILRYGGWPWQQPRLWWTWAALGAALILPWIGRNVMMSGYPLYQSTLLPLPVPWRMSEDIAREAGRVIHIWAATNNASFPYTADWFWFEQWWSAFPFFARQAFVFGMILLLLNQGLMFLLRKRGIPDLGAAVLSMIAIVSIGIWFLMAPSYRHSGALIWIFLASEILVAYRLLTGARWITHDHAAAFALVLVIALWQPANQFSNNLSRKMMLIAPTEQVLAEQAVPRSSYRQRATNFGLIINIPPEGVEECWNAPLPCTTAPNFLASLKLMADGDLQKGFKREK